MVVKRNSVSDIAIKVNSERVTLSIPEGLIRLDDIPLFRVHALNGEVWLRFKDYDIGRCNRRKARLIDIRLSDFMVKLSDLVQTNF